MIKRNGLQNKILFLVIFLSTFSTFFLLVTHYDSTNSPDFGKYFPAYSNYFNGNQENSNLEQGGLYFYLASFFLSIGDEKIVNGLISEYINYKIQLLNTFLFILSLIFLYLFLLTKQINKTTALLCLISVNFFPPVLGLRMIYKPEILLFLLNFIALYFIEMYKKTREKFFLVSITVVLALMISTKLVSGLIITTFLCAYLLKEWEKINYKKIFQFLIPTFFFFLIFSLENLGINGYWFFQHPTSAEFQNTAPFSFFTSLPISTLIKNPFQHNLNNSAFGIILLETFDDYFNIYWNNDKSILNIAQVLISKKFQFVVQYLAIASTLLFYGLAIFLSLGNKKYRIFLLAPFIGIICMFLVSFFILFNPETGDPIKNYYYATLLAVSLIFILVSIEKFLDIRVLGLIIILQVIIVSIIIGFPKDYSYTSELKYEDQITVMNICSVYDSLFSIHSSRDCVNEGTFCKLNFSYKLSPEFREGKWTYKTIEPLKALKFNNNNSESIADSVESCNFLLQNKYKASEAFYLKRNPPYLSIWAMALMLVNTFRLCIYSLFKNKNYK
jgi:hypothetical protein